MRPFKKYKLLSAEELSQALEDVVNAPREESEPLTKVLETVLTLEMGDTASKLKYFFHYPGHLRALDLPWYLLRKAFRQAKCHATMPLRLYKEVRDEDLGASTAVIATATALLFYPLGLLCTLFLKEKVLFLIPWTEIGLRLTGKPWTVFPKPKPWPRPPTEESVKELRELFETG